jgi:hypothetical protein
VRARRHVGSEPRLVGFQSICVPERRIEIPPRNAGAPIPIKINQDHMYAADGSKLPFRPLVAVTRIPAF